MGKFNKQNLFTTLKLPPASLIRQLKTNDAQADGDEWVPKQLLGVKTHIFSGINRDYYSDRPPCSSEEIQRRKELYSKLTKTPSSNKTNQRVKTANKLSLKERWEAAKKLLAQSENSDGN